MNVVVVAATAVFFSSLLFGVCKSTQDIVKEAHIPFVDLVAGHDKPTLSIV